MHVEQGGKEIVLEIRPKDRGLIPHQAGWCRRTKMRKDRHDRRTRPLVLFDGIVLFAIDAAVNGVDQSIAPATTRMLEKRRCEDSFAAACEHHFDRIVHASRHHRLDTRTIRTTAEDMRSTRDKRGLTGTFVPLLRKRAL